MPCPWTRPTSRPRPSATPQTLEEIAGSPPVLDLVHLGLGADGHTASLVPGDPVLDVTDADVALTGVYQGRRRMTLTYPILDRARRILWVVTGSDKAGPARQPVERRSCRSRPAACVRTRPWSSPIGPPQDRLKFPRRGDDTMRVGIATDHGGFGLKEELVAQLRAAGHEVVDFGAHTLDPHDDYPDFVSRSPAQSWRGRSNEAWRSAEAASARRSAPTRSRASAPRSSTTTSRRSRAWRTTT